MRFGEEMDKAESQDHYNDFLIGIKILLMSAQPVFNDSPSTGDYLGISPELRSLAEILLLKETRPPLTVGVIGDYGSGKSFAMHLLQEYIADQRSRPVQKGWPDDPLAGTLSPFAGHIYQVNYNAWANAQSDLWQSLEHTIFSELDRQLSLERIFSRISPPASGGSLYHLLYDPQIKPDHRLHDLLKEYGPTEVPETASIEASAGRALWDFLRIHNQPILDQLDQLKTQVARIKVELNRALRYRHEWASALLDKDDRIAALFAIKDELLKNTGGFVIGKVANQLKSNRILTEEEVRITLGRLRSPLALGIYIWKSIQQNWGWTLIFIALSQLVLFLFPWLLKQYFGPVYLQYYFWMQMIRIAGATLILAWPAIHVSRRWNEEVIFILNDYEQARLRGRETWQERRIALLHRERQEEQAALLPVINNLFLTREQKQAALLNLAETGNLTAYERLVELLENEADESRQRIGMTARFSSLTEFLRARRDQTQQLATAEMHMQIQKDFEELTSSFSILPWDDPETIHSKQALLPRGDARLILYIHDLERCPPERILEIFETIWLLLSTELFLVILGMDTSGIAVTLGHSYPDLLRRAGVSSSLGYLEKIIQIPYGVRSIDSQARKFYLRSQVDIEEASIPEDQLSAPIAISPEAEIAPLQYEPDLSVEAPAVPLPEQLIRFQQQDRDNLLRLGEVLDFSPRQIKRLVNTLKILKLVWFRDSYDHPPLNQMQAITGLLALSETYIELMSEVYLKLDRLYQEDRLMILLSDALSDILSLDTLEKIPVRQKEIFVDKVRLLSKEGFFMISLQALGRFSLNLTKSFCLAGAFAGSLSSHVVYDELDSAALEAGADTGKPGIDRFLPPSEPSQSKAEVLLVTVTKVETQAVFQAIEQITYRKPQPAFIDNHAFSDLGEIKGARIFLVQSEMGAVGPGASLLTVHKSITALQPKAVIMVGIAFGARPEKQQMGEILVSKQIQSYEAQKVKANRLIPRGDRVAASTTLLQRFRMGDNTWEGAKVNFGLVLSGEKLIDNLTFRNKLLKLEPEAIGGEMEGAGLYAAASDLKVNWILVKAICDWADGKKGDDYQSIAAKNAAEFTAHVLSQGGFT